MDLHGLHVLLAEDNDLNAEIAVSLLEEQGMIVTRAADGKSALIQFCNTAPGTFDLILMDIMMPEMNGYETTKAIRNLPDRPDGKEIPIIPVGPKTAIVRNQYSDLFIRLIQNESRGIYAIAYGSRLIPKSRQEKREEGE